VKRSPLLRKTPLRSKTRLVSTTRLERSSLLSRSAPMKRTRFKVKPRRPKPGDDPERKAFIKLFPCVVGGTECGPSDPHHEIDAQGEHRKGMGQTAPDDRTFPMCRRHHEDFHNGRGFCRGWSKEKRRSFQEAEIDRFNKIWAEYQETGSLVEPLQVAV